MRRAFAIVAVAYGVALAAALAVGFAVDVHHPIAVAAWADVAATVAVFAFSLAYRNSSFYDAYWSLAPIAIAFYWLLRPDDPAVDGGRQRLVTALVCLWGLRLTWNWARGWTGLDHEDWRYRMLRERTGRAYWLVSFAGIHMLPTAWVFLGCLSLYPALCVGARGLGALDALAAAVTAGGIALEAGADQQLRRFRLARPGPQAVLDRGLWARCRHPNYLGEMSFWWGLWLFALASAPSAADFWWTILGPVSITIMFRFVSLPMIESRMLERHADFESYAERVPMLLPRLRTATR